MSSEPRAMSSEPRAMSSRSSRGVELRRTIAGPSARPPCSTRCTYFGPTLLRIDTTLHQHYFCAQHYSETSQRLCAVPHRARCCRQKTSRSHRRHPRRRCHLLCAAHGAVHGHRPRRGTSGGSTGRQRLPSFRPRAVPPNSQGCYPMPHTLTHTSPCMHSRLHTEQWPGDRQTWRWSWISCIVLPSLSSSSSPCRYVCSHGASTHDRCSHAVCMLARERCVRHERRVATCRLS